MDGLGPGVGVRDAESIYDRGLLRDRGSRCWRLQRAGPRFPRPILIHLYAQLKDLIEAVIGLDRKVLHAHLGVILFLRLTWCFPGPHRYRKALVWLFVIELVNQFFDVLTAYDQGFRPYWSDSVADIINTMIWPTIWCLYRCRLARALASSAAPETRLLAPGTTDQARNKNGP